MVSIRDIRYNIGSKEILKGITTEFLPGEFNMILGPNGSGKSSLLKIFSGAVNSYEGQVMYDGQALPTISAEMFAKRRAVMTQQPELNFPLTVEEVVMMGRYPHFRFSPSKIDFAVCGEIIEKMGLTTFRKRDYNTLSGGEKQRVHFARVLTQIWDVAAKGSAYLFLDEPLNNLDISYQQEFLSIARSMLQNGIVLIAVMHDINLAMQYADKLFFMKEGKLIASGPAEEILNQPLIRAVFNVDVEVTKNPFSGKSMIVFR